MRRRRFLTVSVLIGSLWLSAASTAAGGYMTGNSGVWVNKDGFTQACGGVVDNYPAEMAAQASTGFADIGLTAAYDKVGHSFTRTAFLSALTSVIDDGYGEAGIYVHSHGDVYNATSIQAAFLQDPPSGCNSYTRDYVSAASILATRQAAGDGSTPEGLVIMSTCFLGAITQPFTGHANLMPEAFDIAKNHTGVGGFYMGYSYSTYDSAMYRFEGFFFSWMKNHFADSFYNAWAYAAAQKGYAIPDSSDPFVPDWYGSARQ